MKMRVLKTMAASAGLLLILALLFQVALAQTITIEVVKVGMGTVVVDPVKDLYDLNETIALTATAESGWVFAGWQDTINPSQLDGETATSVSYQVTAQDDVITATFTEVITCLALEIAIVPSDSGTVSVSSDKTSESCAENSYPTGAVVTLQAAPANGYKFDSWAGATPGIDPKSATVTMDSAKSVTATFALRCQSLLFSHTDNGSDPAVSSTVPSPSGCESGLYKPGTLINLSATPAVGWRVASWQETNNDASTANTNQLTMPFLPADKGHTVTVNYVQKPTLSFASPTFQVDENVDVGTASITVNRLGDFSQAVSVFYDTGAPGDTAVPGQDYVDVNGPIKLDFTANQTSNTFPITIIDDQLAAGSPELTLTLSSPTGDGAVLGTITNAKLKINDDEGKPQVQFSAANYSVGESDGQIAVTVNLSPAPAQDVIVDFLTADGTATAGQDYTAIARRTLRFRFNQGETTKTIPVQILGDTLDEEEETVQLILEDVSGATLGDNATAVLTINDDDDTPTLQFSASQYFVKKGQSSSAVLPVNLSTASGLAVEVDYTITLNESGTPSTGTLVFAPGSTTRDITVPLASATVGDQFAVQLQDAVNAALGEPAAAVLYVLDTDITDCRLLEFTFTGYGEAPAPASKENSLGCPTGQYVAGETINIFARPATGWFVSQWSGTIDDESIALQNAVEMPDQDHTVHADYRVALFLPVTNGPVLFFDGPDEEEPNSLFADANGPILPDRTYLGGFPTADDGDDRFYFNLAQTAGITVTLDSMEKGQDYNLYVYDTNWSRGHVGYSGQLDNLMDKIVLNNLNPGKYYIRVFRAEGDPTSDKYELRLTIK